ncbi:MAG TPA: hypothetical protein VFU69_04645 [Ktedonobacterales bacterium]|nr:hypothetical protein [Ktedonobacterales bacterium]
MAMATCWNCGARVAGTTCQMCGAAQQAGGTQDPPASVPGGQPVVSQASMSVRSPQSTSSQYPYPPAGQAGGWQGQPSAPGQGGWPGYPPQPSYQPPSAYQQQQAAMGMPPAAPAGQAAVLALPLVLALVGGLVGMVVGALAWAFFLQLTKTNFFLLGVLPGLAVGFGVLIGSGGQRRNLLLALLAGVLGLFAFFLALYFRLGLIYANVFGEGSNVFALPVGDYFDALKLYLQDNPINYINFALVPLFAALSAFNGGGRRSRRR